MIISLMHIHLAENVKLMSRRVEFWEAVLFFSPYWENRDTSPLLNSGQYLMIVVIVENVTIFCHSCRNENCKSNSSTRPEKTGQCSIFFRLFSV